MAPPEPSQPDDTLALVARARAGEREALERLVREIQPGVHTLAQRFLWHPEDAEDAAQEILIRVITGLGGFRGDSRFSTWVYRVACNTLASLKPGRMERASLDFDAFGKDLERGLSDAPLATAPGVDEALLLEEVKIGCTTAMLLCLDRPHRLAYVMGEILELDHREASAALEVSPAAFRKRLSRARARIIGFMRARCGLLHPQNACRCRRRVNAALALGRVDPHHLQFASSAERARDFPRVLEEIRALDELRRAAVLFRSHPAPAGRADLATWLKSVVAGGA